MNFTVELIRSRLEQKQKRESKRPAFFVNFSQEPFYSDLRLIFSCANVQLVQHGPRIPHIWVKKTFSWAKNINSGIWGNLPLKISPARRRREKIGLSEGTSTAKSF